MSQLEALGVPRGVPVMVHASLRKLGPVQGGAAALIEALSEIVGPDGTLLAVVGAVDRVPFDARTTPAHEDMGVFAEVLRRHPHARVNDHAAARYAALGACADGLLQPIPLDDYHGPGSVLDRLVQMHGAVLRLGANLDTLTLTHLAEYRARIPNKRRVRRLYIRADTGEQWIHGLDDDDGIDSTGDGAYFEAVLREYLSAGRARLGRVGDCTAELLNAADFVEFATTYIERALGH